MTKSGQSSKLYRVGTARFEASAALAERFFEAEAGRVASACLAIARRFLAGGRLLAFGAGRALTDAQHISVEFVHPVIVGKRALPAIALGTDVASALDLASKGDLDRLYAEQIDTLGRPADIALGIDSNGTDEAVRAGLDAARASGMLTVALSGGDGGRLARDLNNFSFVVPADDPALVQEIHETLYHVLWELVHVFFDHKALLAEEKNA